MDDLIEALTIFRKYLNEHNSVSPLNCTHDQLWIMDVNPEEVSKDDASRLDALGFFIDDDGYASHRFGSA